MPSSRRRVRPDSTGMDALGTSAWVHRVSDCIHYLCPEPVPIVQHFGTHLEAYMPADLERGLVARTKGGSSVGGGSTDPLERAVLLYAAAARAAGAHMQGNAAVGFWSMRIDDAAATLIETHEQALDKSLAELAAAHTG